MKTIYCINSTHFLFSEIGGGTYKFKVVFMEECPSNSLTVYNSLHFLYIVLQKYVSDNEN